MFEVIYGGICQYTSPTLYCDTEKKFATSIVMCVRFPKKRDLFPSPGAPETKLFLALLGRD